jgi:hypothetical protein
MADEEILALLKEMRAEQQAMNAKLDVLTEGLGALRVSVQDLEDKVELLQGSIIRLDGQGVEAMALVRMLERHDRRIKAVEDRTKQ